MTAIIITVLICIGVIFILLLLKNDYVRYTKIDDYINEIEERIESIEESKNYNATQQVIIEELKYWKRKAEKLL